MSSSLSRAALHLPRRQEEPYIAIQDTQSRYHPGFLLSGKARLFIESIAAALVVSRYQHTTSKVGKPMAIFKVTSGDLRWSGLADSAQEAAVKAMREWLSQKSNSKMLGTLVDVESVEARGLYRTREVLKELSASDNHISE